MYEGSFSYGSSGQVYGTLEKYTFISGGNVVYQGENIGANANTIAYHVNSGDAQAAYSHAFRLADTFSGSYGKDAIYTGGGDDLVYGNGGRDNLSGNAGNDSVYGNQGTDLLYGDDGNDWLFGGRHADGVNGGAGDDFVYGNLGRDDLRGGDGYDALFGGQGHDTLSGGATFDDLWGGVGFDVMTGGRGDDYFFLDGGGTDRITDFDASEGDRIGTFSGFDSYDVVGNPAGTAVIWSDGNQNGTVILEDVEMSDFSADWIL